MQYCLEEFVRELKNRNYAVNVHDIDPCVIAILPP